MAPTATVVRAATVAPAAAAVLACSSASARRQGGTPVLGPIDLLRVFWYFGFWPAIERVLAQKYVVFVGEVFRVVLCVCVCVRGRFGTLLVCFVELPHPRSG